MKHLAVNLNLRSDKENGRIPVKIVMIDRRWNSRQIGDWVNVNAEPVWRQFLGNLASKPPHSFIGKFAVKLMDESKFVLKTF